MSAPILQIRRMQRSAQTPQLLKLCDLEQTAPAFQGTCMQAHTVEPEVQMPAYLYSARKNGSQREELGSIELPSDAGARAFAKRMIADILRDNPRNYSGWTLEIIKEGRAVAGLPYKAR
jgi:hypothetical protein